VKEVEPDPDRACQLAMIVPSRGRPGNIAELQRAWDDTSTGEARLIVAVDDDDPALDEYVAQRGHLTVIGQRRRCAGTLNWLAPQWARRCYAVGFMGDDHRPRTAGWDGELLDALHELGTGLVYGDDLYQRERLPTAVAMTSDIVKVLGYMAPPGQVHLYLDDFWLLLGQRLGRIRYLDQVVIEHVHPFAGKAPSDPGYLEVNSAERAREDRAAWQLYAAGQFEADLEKIRRVMR
jgi:hypothetical protein